MRHGDGELVFLLRFLLYVVDKIVVPGEIGGKTVLQYSTVSVARLSIVGIRGRLSLVPTVRVLVLLSRT